MREAIEKRISRRIFEPKPWGTETVERIRTMLDKASGLALQFVEDGSTAPAKRAKDLRTVASTTVALLAFGVLFLLTLSFDDTFPAERAEIKAISEKITTLEEMLDTAHAHGVKLYIEMKGRSADERMADAGAIITDEVAIVERLKAELADRTYLERVWDTVLYRW